MYLQKFWVNTTDPNQSFQWDFRDSENQLTRWAFLREPDPAKRLLLFKLLSICLGATAYASALAEQMKADQWKPFKPVDFGVNVLSEPGPGGANETRCVANLTFAVSEDGHIVQTNRKKHVWTGSYKRLSGFSDTERMFGDFVYGVSSRLSEYIPEKEDPNFIPRLRGSRFGTFFEPRFPLTEPNAWLWKQRQRARYGGARGTKLLNTALTAVSRLMPGLSFSRWDSDRKAVFKSGPKEITLDALPETYRVLTGWLIDFVRQLGDSRRTEMDLVEFEGILLTDDFERCFHWKDHRVDFLKFSTLFPNIQFILGCKNLKNAWWFAKSRPERVPCNADQLARAVVTEWIAPKAPRPKNSWSHKTNFQMARFPEVEPAGRDDVVLVDVDSEIPNLALMKLSRFYKEKGRRVVLCRDSRGHAESGRVFASIVFNRKPTRQKVSRLKKLHGKALRLGGSGVDLSTALPDEIETLMPDYTLYNNVDYAMGFLTRGCPHGCDYCTVPEKEGSLRRVADLDDILPRSFDKLVLLDNNILAYPGADKLLREMINRKLKVNFNQSLDIRCVNEKLAGLLEAVDSRSYSFKQKMYYFSLSSASMIPVVRKKIALLSGLKKTEIKFLCMFGFDTTLSDDLARFSFLKEMGVTPFTQKFQTIVGGPKPRVKTYIDTEVDPLMNLHFGLNGKVFENFLKYVSEKYFEETGEFHMPLVDRIFKYNNKHGKYKYLARATEKKSTRTRRAA